MGKRSATLFLELLENQSNVEYITRYFKWNLIEVDPDDNKFVDCAIAANANFIATHDKHFKILKDINFPKVNVIDIEGLRKILT